jgi:hypothetical protein
MRRSLVAALSATVLALALARPALAHGHVSSEYALGFTYAIATG